MIYRWLGMSTFCYFFFVSWMKSKHDFLFPRGLVCLLVAPCSQSPECMLMRQLLSVVAEKKKRRE